MNDSRERFLRYLRNVQLAEASGCLHEPGIQFDLEASLSPLRHGEIAAKACRRLEARLFRRLTAASLYADPAPAIPEYDPDIAFPIARIVATGSLLSRPINQWTGHAVFPGATGSGKTTGEAKLADEFVKRGIRVVFFARKEAGRLLMRYPNATLLRPHQLPLNFMEPIGDPQLFFAEWVPIIARGIGLRSDYISKYLNVALRVAKGRKTSLKTLEKVFRRLGQQGDRRCDTIASALATFNLFLGDTARIEDAPPWEDQFQVTILDREGAPPAYRSCLDGMMQHRFQAQSAQEGYTSKLRRVIFYDEAGLEFGREFEAYQVGSGFVSSAKRSVSQMRSYGVGMIYSCQSYGSMLEDVKDNANTIVAFRTLSNEDLRELALRMSLTERDKQRFPSLPPGRAFVAAPDLAAPVEVQFDFVDLGPYPSEEQIAARMDPVLRELRSHIVFTREDPIEPLDVDELLGEQPPASCTTQPPVDTNAGPIQLLADHWALLRDVAKFPESGVAARFHRLGFGGSKGNRIKEELLAMGLLEVLEVRRSAVGGVTKVLRLTDLARTLPDL